VAEGQEAHQAVSDARYNVEIMRAPVTALSLLLLISLPSKQTNNTVQQPSNARAQSNNCPAQSRSCPPPAPSVVQQFQLSQPAPDPDKSEGKDKSKASGFINSYSTLVIAIFTVLTFVVFRNQLRASKISERAWVVPNIVSSEPQDEGGMADGFQVMCLLENRGRTPAWLTALGSRGQLVKLSGALPQKPEYTWASPFPPEGTVLPPDGHIEQGFPLKAGDLSHIEAGTSVLYVYGAVKYRDIYGDKHETKYCFVFRPKPTGDNPAPRGFYIAGPAGYNSAT
jgi:hypothetical protein